MKIMTVLSGKGGAGKTTLTAGFAQLSERTVTADCDVDGADLSLILNGREQSRELFFSGFAAQIDREACGECGLCRQQCRFGCIEAGPEGFRVREESCEGCGVCGDNCPAGAVRFVPREAGLCLQSETAWGPLVHARLHPGGDNSGKLVTRVKELAQELGGDRDLTTMLIDGPPGIGCPVLASMNQSERVLVVTEPTPSGLHDMERLARLLRHFKIPGALCTNKADLNRDLSDEIRRRSGELDLAWLGEIPYEPAVPAALREGLTPLEAGIEPVQRAIEKIWERWNESM